VVLNYCAQEDIEPQHSAPYNPQSNGSAESLNMILWKKATFMLPTSGLKCSTWSEAVMTANYVRNRSPHANTPDNATPCGLWRNIKPSIGYIRLFGCDAYAVVPLHKRDKFSPKAELGNFVGYDQYSGAYKIYYSNTNTVKVIRDVVFNELPLLQSSIKKLSLLQDSTDNLIANRAPNRKAHKNQEEEETSDETIPTQPLITNTEGQLEYEFDHLRIQDHAQDNIVPMEPFVPDEEEYIEGLPVDDELVPPPPGILVNRDIYDHDTHDAGSGDFCDGDVPEYD
jgi:hypothetical protein